MPQIPECRDHTRLSRWLQPSEQASNRLWDGVRGNYEVRLRKRTYGVSDTEVYTAYEDRHTSNHHKKYHNFSIVLRMSGGPIPLIYR